MSIIFNGERYIDTDFECEQDEEIETSIIWQKTDPNQSWDSNTNYPGYDGL